MKALAFFRVSCISVALIAMMACSHNPNKAEKVDTELKGAGTVSGEQVGVKNGDLIVQRKVLMSEELRDLQNEVYKLEETVYGNATFGTAGLYGILKKCRADMSERKNGGDGHLIWTEPIERVTQKEEEFKIGFDEHDKLVAVSEEFLKDRIARFNGYKKLLSKRQDEYQQKVDVCKADLASRMYDMEHKQAEQ